MDEVIINRACPTGCPGDTKGRSNDLVSLRWSSETPEETGWYWLRSAPRLDDDGKTFITPDEDDGEIVLVRGDTDTCKKRAFSVDGGKMWVENYSGVEWAGPISLPAN